MNADVERYAGRWRVIRHGGRATDDWHVLFAGPEEMAREEFARVVRAMRQGGAQLLDPAGIVYERASAPRLRTRW